MPLIIDGYNLLHLSGMMPARLGPGGLERARLALVNLLSASLEAAERNQTCVVFDAANAPPGLPLEFTHRSIRVRFADPGKEADDVIEEMIRRHSTPKRLTVVSSDHRVQRAAQRRGARSAESGEWFDALIATRRRQPQASQDSPAVEHEMPRDVEYWLEYFGGESALAEWERLEVPADSPVLDEPSEAEADEEGSEKPRPGEMPQLDDPFPPGYGDDLLRGSE
jgi:hypothetical protein